MSTDVEATRRQLTIKSGGAKRLLKEHTLYRQEVEDNKRKLDKFRADGAEAWDIRNGTSVLEESKKMVIDADNRLGKAVVDLRELVIRAKKMPELQQDEVLLKAEEALEEASV